MEGIIYAVKKSIRYPLGQPAFALSQAHGALIPYSLDAYYSVASANGGSWEGFLQFWPDQRQYWNRPVAMIRTRTHGTYSAQDGGPGCFRPFKRDNGFGIDIFSPQDSGYYLACVHSGMTAMFYQPEDPSRVCPEVS